MSYAFPVNEGQFIIERKDCDGKSLPAYVTQKNTPRLYEAIFNDPLTQYINNDPFVYDLSIQPNNLTYYRDPAKIEPSSIYGQIYQNNNGIKVLIQGEYDSVMSTLDVLKTYPPNKITQGVYFNILDGLPINSSSNDRKNVPKVAYTTAVNDQIIILENGKKYSGSGVLIIAVDESKPINKSNAKIILVNGNTTNMYEDFGGKIDKSVPVNIDTLFNNAIKETQEESMMLFQIVSRSNTTIEIESQESGTYYKLHVYLIRVKDINKLPQLYESNKLQVYNSNKDKAYKETNALRLFNYDDFVAKIQELGSSANIISKSSFRTTDNDFVNVRSRVIKSLTLLVNSPDKPLDKLFNQSISTSLVFSSQYNIIRV